MTTTAAAATALSVLALTACGSSSSGSAAATTAADADAATTAPAAHAGTGATAARHAQKATEKPATARSVGVVLGGSAGEFSITPMPASTSAGKVAFRVRNAGTTTHEMVVVRTDKKAADLAPDGAARADESGSLGETGDLPAGATANLTLTLPAGHYALLCNLPGHYAGGMYVDFAVR